MGRKNWTFAGSDEGGKWAAVIYSLTATCKANGVDPWAYMTDVLERISSTRVTQFLELLPDEWRKARETGPKS